MPATIRSAPAVLSVRGTMPTIWGHLENVDKAPARSPHIQVRTSLPGGIVIRIRANIGAQTLIARGTEPVDVSGLRDGEFVEVSYRHGREGRLDADTIYVRPEQSVVS
jgi:hypothetical protein